MIGLTMVLARSMVAVFPSPSRFTSIVPGLYISIDSGLKLSVQAWMRLASSNDHRVRADQARHLAGVIADGWTGG